MAAMTMTFIVTSIATIQEQKRAAYHACRNQAEGDYVRGLDEPNKVPVEYE